MKNWNEIQTAYQVARLGTVSAAANVLGVHRATVIRHIDALEAELGEKIFQRHNKGYVPTELGLDLMRVAGATEDQFNQLLGKAKCHEKELSGDFMVTSLDIAASILLPLLKGFQKNFPKLVVHFISSDQLLRLEYGEAHIAVRFGSKPNHPDLVVQFFDHFKLGMYASKEYYAENGIPRTPEDYSDHFFLSLRNKRGHDKISRWVENNIPSDRIIFRGSSPATLNQAIINGLGIGLFPVHLAQKRSDLVEILPSQPAWQVPMWLITHVDLHRSAKVQKFVKFLKHEGLLKNTDCNLSGNVSC